MKIVTRFAPAPTGSLHIGGARTALFNYLYAKANNGTFLLRIEDTDQSRSSNEYTEQIKKSLEWMGIQWDKEIMFQSDRFSIYNKIASRLVNEGNAYKCYTTPEEEEEIKALHDVRERNYMFRQKANGNGHYTIRFKMPDNYRFTINDLIMGTLEHSTESLDDFVLIKKDGTPTYMIANIVDDEAMNTSHIIRGNDHLSNTYRQIPLIHALSFKQASYMHIPLINDESGKKLSKRLGAKSIDFYRESGILPEALCNYILRLGWSHGNDEVIDMETAIKIFMSGSFNKAAASINPAKLLSLNAHYIRNMDKKELIKKMNLSKEITDKAIKCIDNICEKHDNLKSIKEVILQIFGSDNVRYQEDMPKKPDTIDSLNITDYSSPEIVRAQIIGYIEENNLCKKEILMYIRIAITGMRVSPGLFEVIYALGKKLVDYRLFRATHISSSKQDQ